MTFLRTQSMFFSRVSLLLLLKRHERGSIYFTTLLSHISCEKVELKCATSMRTVSLIAIYDCLRAESGHLAVRAKMHAFGHCDNA